MVARPPINPGRVAWSGDNSGIYLKRKAHGPFVTRASYFRIVHSPHGRGHALLLVTHEGDDVSADPSLSLCLTDNEPLARYLVSEYARHFQQFRDIDLAAVVDYLPLDAVHAGGDGVKRHEERIAAPGYEVALWWEAFNAPYFVQLPAKRSATGLDEMFNVRMDARRAGCRINGRPAPGNVFPCDYEGRSSTTAFLALSETWVRPAGG
ncbi:MAG: hypothetical protein ACE5JZ_04745 [Kiloniellales bacterium]